MTTPMDEIEAKFLVPSSHLLGRIRHRLRYLPEGYAPGEWSRNRLQDRYLDTGDRALERSGWALRIRKRGSTKILAKKSLGAPVGGVHRRQELDTEIRS